MTEFNISRRWITEAEFQRLETLSPQNNMISLLTAFQFLTTFPAIIRRTFTAQELGRAVGYFPLVGLALGGVLYGLEIALRLIFPFAGSCDFHPGCLVTADACPALRRISGHLRRSLRRIHSRATAGDHA